MAISVAFLATVLFATSGNAPASPPSRVLLVTDDVLSLGGGSGHVAPAPARVLCGKGRPNACGHDTVP